MVIHYCYQKYSFGLTFINLIIIFTLRRSFSDFFKNCQCAASSLPLNHSYFFTSAGENKLNGVGVLCHIASVDAADVVSDILAQQVQVGCGGGPGLPRHVCHVPGTSHPHRAERLFPRQRSHVQEERTLDRRHLGRGRLPPKTIHPCTVKPSDVTYALFCNVVYSGSSYT